MSLYILDTDHVSLHQRNHPRLIAKLHTFTPGEVTITAVTLEEQMRGRLAQIGQSGTNLTLAYALLSVTVDYFCGLTILPFDDVAHQQYDRLRTQKIRIGTLDLRIAAIVLSQHAILVTRNQRDFAQVPELKQEDWS